MASFDDFLKELRSEITELVEKGWKDLKGPALSDMSAFVEKSQADLKRWTGLLASGQLTITDFEFLLAAKKDVAEMTALKQAGLAQVQLDRLVNGVVGAIIHAATTVFL
jgi:hypothetical protein